jgi:hypothetical protein
MTFRELDIGDYFILCPSYDGLNKVYSKCSGNYATPVYFRADGSVMDYQGLPFMLGWDDIVHRVVV